MYKFLIFLLINARIAYTIVALKKIKIIRLKIVIFNWKFTSI